MTLNKRLVSEYLLKFHILLWEDVFNNKNWTPKN
jgi:hypothetical protein